MLEVASTFARKPLFGYKVTVAGFVAISALSIMVWAHHMFTTGWAPELAGPFMVTTEIISIPTGIIFLCLIGTIWKGRIWTRLPMYFVYLFLWNFIIGGVTGIYLSDTPADEFFHGDMFVTAHFHYTLLGGAMIAATAGLCYWFPKITGKMLNERIGKTAFWMIAIGIQVTYFGMFWEGFEGMPRRVAFYDPIFQHANDMATGGAYLLMLGWIVLLYAGIDSLRHGPNAPANPWHSKTLEWKVPTPGAPGRTSWSIPWSPPIRMATVSPSRSACRHSSAPSRSGARTESLERQSTRKRMMASGHHHRSARSGPSRRGGRRPPRDARATPFQRAHWPSGSSSVAMLCSSSWSSSTGSTCAP